MLPKRVASLVFYIISIFFVLASAAFAILYIFGKDLPSDQTLVRYSPPRTTRIFSRDGELIEEYAIEHRVITDLNKIPTIIKGAFIVAEDREFYNHSGISITSLFRAITDNTARKNWTRKPAGGSTITQQIAKNLLVGNARTITRKIREAIMAFRIEAVIPKDKILEFYLNQLYLGKGCYGIAEACDYYFGKKLDQIEPHEAAFLASLPSAPMVYINKKNSLKLLRKRNAILNQMHEMGYIDKTQFKKYFNKPIKIKHKKQKLRAPYFSDEIFRIVTKAISRNDFFRNGYQITTTLDRKIQYMAQKALEDGLIEYTKRTRWNGTIGNVLKNPDMNLEQLNANLPTTICKIQACIVKDVLKDCIRSQTSNGKTIDVWANSTKYKDAKFKKGDVVLCREIGKNSYELYQTPKVTGGIIVMDAHSGDILALVGGYSPDISAFNCMTQAMRQPGSTIKPFVYASALENGKDEYDLIYDKPVTITLKSGEKYTPHNYDGKAHGETYLRDGLIYSRNLSTVNLALEIGMDKISQTLKSFELTKGNVPISAVLGSIEVCPVKLLEAFSAFFNDGQIVHPKFIMKANINDLVVTQRQKNVISPSTAKVMQNILHDAVVVGTGSKIADLEDKYNVKLFGKTGTTNDYKDAWFLGAVKKADRTLLVCTFVGYSTPKSLGEHMTGAKVALPIFANFVNQYVQ